MRRRRQSKGFTLVELAIVVATIGVMAALASYQVSRAQERSRFRAGVRDVMSMITEARGMAIHIAGAVTDGRVTDVNGDCPVSFRSPVGAGAAAPGLAINTATNQITTIQNVIDGAPNAALPFPISQLPTLEIDCRTDDLQEMYRGAIRINYTTGGATPDGAATLNNNGANTIFVGFDGRGMASTIIPTAGAPAYGRLRFDEPATTASPLRQFVLVSASGQVCIESDQWRCSNGWRTN